jgi:UDP-N-acetylmuramate dehydrogenase
VVSPRGFDRFPQADGALAARTSLGVGGRPRHLLEPSTEAECAAIVSACRAAALPFWPLGAGCNLLVDDGDLPGVVIATRRLRHWHVLPDRVEVGAGRSFPALVRRAADLGLPGLSGCPGIPGSVGGVVVMNAGGRFGHVADALLEVWGVDPDGGVFRRAVRDGDLGYRQSVFEGSVVTGAVFRRDPALDPDAQRTLFEEALAWKRATQPLSAASAGCIFRNPTGAGAGRSAGWWIEQAGLKGRRVGGAMVSPVHANFIVNAGGASARDVHGLIELVRAEVRAAHGVELELEVRTWGRAGR